MKKSDKIKGVFEIDMDNNFVNYIITSTHTIQKNRIELMGNFIENANHNIEVEDRLTKQQREKIWCILDEFAYCFGRPPRLRKIHHRSLPSQTLVHPIC